MFNMHTLREDLLVSIGGAFRAMHETLSTAFCAGRHQTFGGNVAQNKILLVVATGCGILNVAVLLRVTRCCAHHLADIYIHS